MYANQDQENLRRMVRWMSWHCPPDTECEPEPWRSEAEHAISRSRSPPPPYWNFTSERIRNILFFWNLNARVWFKPPISDFPSRQLQLLHQDLHPSKQRHGFKFRAPSGHSVSSVPCLLVYLCHCFLTRHLILLQRDCLFHFSLATWIILAKYSRNLREESLGLDKILKRFQYYASMAVNERQCVTSASSRSIDIW